MSFGKNLQYLRQLSKNMTQEALAEKLNVSRQTISKWEMDAANPEMDKALEICRIFIAPEHFRKGYGVFMMREVENMFPEVKEFTLDTPVWNVRTNSFYSKLGYMEIKRNKEFVFYSKYH